MHLWAAIAALGAPRSCDELGWGISRFAVAAGVKGVCGETLPCAGPEGLTFADAAHLCSANFARLCTGDELFADVARETGCGLDAAVVWARDADGECAQGHLGAPGSSKATLEWGHRRSCMDGSARLSGTRCCSDTVPQSASPYTGHTTRTTATTATTTALGTDELPDRAVQYEAVAFDLAGPHAGEVGGSFNPFLDLELNALFQSDAHPPVAVRGFWAADGVAADSGGSSGGVWRFIFRPPRPGWWQWSANFSVPEGGVVQVRLGGLLGLGPSNSTRPREGALNVTPAAVLAVRPVKADGSRYLRGMRGERWIKLGADSPENLLAFADFDGTIPSHRYEPVRPPAPCWQCMQRSCATTTAPARFLAGRRVVHVERRPWQGAAGAAHLPGVGWGGFSVLPHHERRRRRR